MRLVDQIWEDLCSRKQFASAHQISRKLGIPKVTVRSALLEYYRRGVLDKKTVGVTNKYRIKE